MFIDTHTHLHFEDYDQDRDKVIERAVDSNVKRIISLGIDYSSSLKTVEISGKYEQVFRLEE